MRDGERKAGIKSQRDRESDGQSIRHPKMRGRTRITPEYQSLNEEKFLVL